MNEMLEVIRDGQMFAVKVTYDSAKAFEHCRVGNIPFALKRVGDDAASRCSIGIDGDELSPAVAVAHMRRREPLADTVRLALLCVFPAPHGRR